MCVRDKDLVAEMQFIIFFINWCEFARTYHAYVSLTIIGWFDLRSEIPMLAVLQRVFPEERKQLLSNETPGMNVD